MSVLSTSVTPPVFASIAENEHGLPVDASWEHVANHSLSAFGSCAQLTPNGPPAPPDGTSFESTLPSAVETRER